MAFLNQNVSYTLFAPNCSFVLNALCSCGLPPFIVLGQSNEWMLHHCLHCCCLRLYNTPVLGICNNVFQCGEFHAKLLAVPRSQAFPLDTVVNDLKYGEHQSCVANIYSCRHKQWFLVIQWNFSAYSLFGVPANCIWVQTLVYSA